MKNRSKKIYSTVKKARHPAEIPVTVIAAVITVAFYLLVTYALVIGANDDAVIGRIMNFLGARARVINYCIRIGGPAIFVIFLILLGRLCLADVSYVGKLASSCPKLENTKYEEIKALYADVIKDLEIEKPPAVYIGEVDDPSYLGITVCSNKALCLNPDDIKDALKDGDLGNLKDTIIRKLAVIYLGHYDIPVVLFTFVARLLPIFHSMCERVLCYSVDKFTTEVSGKDEAIRCLFCSRFNAEDYPEDADGKEIVLKAVKALTSYEKSGLGYNNFTSSEPPVAYRLHAMITGKPGKVF